MRESAVDASGCASAWARKLDRLAGGALRLHAHAIPLIPRPAPTRSYHGDLNETIVVGQTDEDSKRLVKAAHDVRREGACTWGCSACVGPCPGPARSPQPCLPPCPAHNTQCLHKAIAICKPGTRYRDIGEAITKHARAQGCATAAAALRADVHACACACLRPSPCSPSERAPSTETRRKTPLHLSPQHAAGCRW